MTDIWFLLEDTDRYVYHYTSAATLTDYILPDRRLRFSRFKAVNDPREAKLWKFGFKGPNHRLDFPVTDPVNEEFNRYLKADWYVGCFCSDVLEAVVEPEAAGAKLFANMLERGHSHPRMWAQYGDGHKGACLVFDRNELGNAIGRAAVGATTIEDRVEYRNPSFPQVGRKNALVIDMREVDALGVEEAARRHMKRYYRDLLFLKSKDWQGEREYRWVVEAADDEFFFVNFEKSLVGILLGSLFPRDHKASVATFCSQHSTSIAHLDWWNGVPEIYPILPQLVS